MNTFEIYPRLVIHMKRMADSGSVGNLKRWNDFCEALNEALEIAFIEGGPSIVRAEEHIKLLLPLAKGYAALNPTVRVNREIIEAAEVALEAAMEEAALNRDDAAMINEAWKRHEAAGPKS